MAVEDSSEPSVFHISDGAIVMRSDMSVLSCKALRAKMILCFKLVH